MKTNLNARRFAGALAALTLCAAVAGCGEQNTMVAVAAKQTNGETATATSEAKPATKRAGAGVKSASIEGSNADNAGSKGIVWATSFEAARAQAKKQNKALMIDFYTDWCGACKMLDAEIFPAAEVVEASRNFVNVKVNAEHRTDIANQYGVTAFPTIIWINADGVPVLRQDGASAQPSAFVAQMNDAHSRYAALGK